MKVALGALMVALLSGCGGEPNTPIRIGMNPWPGYEFLYLERALETTDTLLRELGLVSGPERLADAIDPGPLTAALLEE